jgi:hypothetical protein
MHKYSRLVIAVAASVVLPAAAQAAPPTLAGHVTLSGAWGGYLEVSIPVRVDVAHMTATVTKGTGLRGFELRSEFVDNPYGIPHEVRGLAPLDGDDRVDISGNGDLIPGRYRLYLFTSEGPIDVDLMLPGLSGRASMTPDTSIPVDAGLLTRRPTTSDGHLVIGRSARTESYGFVWYRVGYRFAFGQTGDRESCTYEPTDDPSRDDAYTPGCPGAARHAVTPDVSADRPGVGDYGEGVGVGGLATGASGAAWGIGENARALMGPPPELYGYIAGVSLMPEPGTIPHTVPLPGDDDGAAPPRQPGATPLAVAAPLAHAKGRRALIMLRCPGPGTCRGTASLGAGPPRAFAIRAGATRLIALPLRRGATRAVLRIETRDGAVRRSVIRLRRP